MKLCISFMRLTVIALGALIWTGCATKQLWEENNFGNFHEPATPARIELYQAKKKALVVYDEKRENSTNIQRRAYWIDPKAEPAANPHRAHFVSPKKARDLEPIAFVENPQATGWSATLAPDLHGFTLYRDGEKVFEYQLPVYPGAEARAKQIALTPGALLVDLLIVVGVLAVIAAVGWARSGGPPFK